MIPHQEFGSSVMVQMISLPRAKSLGKRLARPLSAVRAHTMVTDLSSLRPHALRLLAQSVRFRANAHSPILAEPRKVRLNFCNSGLPRLADRAVPSSDLVG